MEKIDIEMDDFETTEVDDVLDVYTSEEDENITDPDDED